jgi:hypothetical protein
VLYVPLPRTDTTPAWRWELVIDQPTASPVVELAGRCDTNGIDAMLDLAVAVNADTYGNVTAC